jgi:hypothetical protein
MTTPLLLIADQKDSSLWATQVSVPVEDWAPAIIEVVQAGIPPIAVSFLTSRV